MKQDIRGTHRFKYEIQIQITTFSGPQSIFSLRTTLFMAVCTIFNSNSRKRLHFLRKMKTKHNHCLIYIIPVLGRVAPELNFDEKKS